MLFDTLNAWGLQSLTEQAVVLRILLAMLFGGALGFERTRKRRAAGFRTYILVCVGATVVMMTGQFVMEYISPNVDPTRLAAQVVSGIGFLGAGTILVTGASQIKGLTTAAGLWASACMGIALGIGFYFGALVMCIAMLLSMTLLEYLQDRYIARARTMRLYILFESLHNITSFNELAKRQHITVEDLEIGSAPVGSGVGVLFSLRFTEKKSHAEVIDMLRDCDGLVSVEEI